MSMIVQLHVKEYLGCLHLEPMTLEKLDAGMIVAPAIARQVQRGKELVAQNIIITGIGFTSIQVSIMSFVDDRVSAF